MFRLVLILMAVFVSLGCTSTKPPEKIVAYVSVAKTASGYQYYYNGVPVTKAKLLEQLKAYSKVVDEPSGLLGPDINGASQNRVQFAADPEVSSRAFVEFYELLMEAWIWKIEYCIEVDGNRICQRHEIYPLEGITPNDTSYKLGVNVRRNDEIISYEAYTSQSLRSFWPSRQEDIAREQWKKLQAGQISEIEHVENRPIIEDMCSYTAWYSPEFNKGKLPIEFTHNKVFASHKEYVTARSELAEAMRAHIKKSGKEITGVVININNISTWGALFLSIDAGFQLGLEHPVYLAVNWR